MNGTYTEQVGKYVINLLDRDSSAIWEKIQNGTAENDAQKWKELFDGIAQDYMLSSRFALMRIICSREQGTHIYDNVAIGSSFSASVNGDSVEFSDISIDHASTMTPKENLLYLDYMLGIAQRQKDCDVELAEYLITRAWYDEESANETADYLIPAEIVSDRKLYKQTQTYYQKANKKKYRVRLSRSEALQLGHMLHFSLEEMQWYLLRVFDYGDGLRFNESEDLIDAYGFLTNASLCRVEELKKQYFEIKTRAHAATLSERNAGWTKNVSDGLLDRVIQWEHQPETMDAEFKKWLGELAPGLDIPSQTALRIYRNLAVFAYDLMIGEECIPGEDEWEDCIQDVYEDPNESGAVIKALYENGSINDRKCKVLADALMLENKIQSASEHADNTNAWHVLTVRSDGKATTAGGINVGRTRVSDLLTGKIQAEKSDFLFLLWFIENLMWQNSDSADSYRIRERIQSFISTADYLLEEAMLPHFYLPHIIEQTMLLSMVYGDKTNEDSAVIYEYILYSFKETRKRSQGSVKHSVDDKIAIVTDYISHPDMTLDQCAAKYSISPKTLSAWQKTLMEQGKIGFEFKQYK